MYQKYFISDTQILLWSFSFWKGRNPEREGTSLATWLVSTQLSCTNKAGISLGFRNAYFLSEELEQIIL